MLYAGFSMQPFKKTDMVGNPIYSFLCQLDLFPGLENVCWTYSSCGASGLNFSLVLTPVELVLKSGILKEIKYEILHGFIKNKFKYHLNLGKP